MRKQERQVDMVSKDAAHWFMLLYRMTSSSVNHRGAFVGESVTAMTFSV